MRLQEVTRGYMRLREFVKGKIKFNEKMAHHTTFRIGGKIDVWVEPKDVDNLKKIIKFSKKVKKPFYVIGSGSNLLVGDKRIKAIGIHLAGPSFEYIHMKGNHLIAGAGLSLAKLLNFCVKKGLSGLEFCAGIPGTVGAAVFMNAGLSQRDASSNMGNFVDRVTVMDKRGRVKIIKKRNLVFGYRTSSINDFIILEVKLHLKRAPKDYIKRRCNAILERKRKTQDLSRPSAGSIFKNPCGGFVSAGKLLELSGLKAQRIGGARVSKKNANYVINFDSAKFKDVKKLITIMRKKVKEEFNTELELEVKIVK